MKNAKNGKKDFAKKGGKKPSYSPVGKKKPTAKKNMPKRPRSVFAPDNGVDSENVVAGRNPVSELLRSGRTVDKLYVAHGEREGSIVKIIAEARDMGIPVVEADKYKLESIAGTSNHQGVVAFATDYDYCDIDDIFAYAEEKGEKPFIIILDGIEDPHNLGSIIRSAVCAGAHGIIIPRRRAVSVTAAACKASAGAVEYAHIARVANIANAIARLKDEGLWIVGADMSGTAMTSARMEGALALVIGSEGDGIGRLVKEKCDFLVSIPMFGQIDSLNAAVAAAVLMFEKRRQDGIRKN